jgi:hypothetical protein
MIMNTSTPVIRLGLLALTGAIILGTATLYSNPGTTLSSAATSTLPTTTLETITVHPSAEDDLVADVAAAALPVLPTVAVGASEEEVLAARLDPTDRIQIMSAITVQPSAEEIAAAMSSAAVAQVGSDDDSFGETLVRAVAEPHRLRLDMPYYSFGKILTRSSK